MMLGPVRWQGDWQMIPDQPRRHHCQASAANRHLGLYRYRPGREDHNDGWCPAEGTEVLIRHMGRDKHDRTILALSASSQPLMQTGQVEAGLRLLSAPHQRMARSSAAPIISACQGLWRARVRITAGNMAIIVAGSDGLQGRQGDPPEATVQPTLQKADQGHQPH